MYMYPQHLSPSAYADQMASDLMVVPLHAPWKSGECLDWDFTCVDTFAASYISDATREARAVATAAEARKEKYVQLSKSHHFVPIAIETSGALGPDALSLLTDISRRQQSMTKDYQSLHSFSRECPLHYSTAMLALY